MLSRVPRSWGRVRRVDDRKEPVEIKLIHYMKPFTKILLVICLLGFGLGLANVGNSVFSGLARALRSKCFFSLTFLGRAFERMDAEPQPA